MAHIDQPLNASIHAPVVTGVRMVPSDSEPFVSLTLSSPDGDRLKLFLALIEARQLVGQVSTVLAEAGELEAVRPGRVGDVVIDDGDDDA